MKRLAILLSTTLALGALPAYASGGDLQRVKPNGWAGALIGHPYAPSTRGLFGIPDLEGKHFRFNQDNATVFQGLGHDVGIMEWFWPGYQVRPQLRQTLTKVPATNDYLKQYEEQIGPAATVGGVGNGLWLAGALATVASVFVGPMENIASSPLLWGGLGAAVLGQIMVRAVSPMMFLPAIDNLDKAIDTYNGRQAVGPSSDGALAAGKH